MRFALFYEIPVARPWGPDSERLAYQQTLAQAVAGEKYGWDAFWTVEHHFLEEYSHCSNPEVLYGAIAALTERMRLGFGVRLMPKPYNHPVRTAEAVAVLDLISNGRVDLGTGRSSTRAELEGFGIDPSDTRGMWQEAAALEPRSSRFAFADAMVWYAKSLGAARSGNFEMAEQSAKVLGDTVEALKAAKDNYWATEVGVQHQAALAWIAFGRGNKEAALAQMRIAADMEDASGKHPVSPGRLIPARELLADMLMQNGSPVEALAQYERSQINDPNRLRGLYGAGLAAAQSNNRERAKYFYARVAELVGPSEARPEFKQVREYLASN